MSNGHGEDLSGSLLAKQLINSGFSVDALPIVGKGIHYKKEKIKIIGKTKEFSTGGIGYNSFKGRLTEIFEGEIIYCSLLNNKGTILCDDYNLSQALGVRKAIEEFSDENKIKYEIIHERFAKFNFN